MAMSRERAVTVALTALGWLAANDDLFPVFMGASGADLDDLRQRAEDEQFLASVLDFILLDDAWIMALSAQTGLDTTEPGAARQALPGGAQVHWT